MTLRSVQDVAPTPGTDRLVAAVLRRRPLAVAFSGGVDSTLLAKVAFDALGRDSLAVTAVSPSLPVAERDAARDLAALVGIRHLEVRTAEDEDPRYVANPANRCYYCKTHLFDALDRILAGTGGWNVAYGATTDDVGDHRPGMDAARERGIAAPLLEAGMGKDEIRELSSRLGLPTWDKPAMACLASRLPYGTPVTIERLGAVEAAESALRDMGFRQVRVRHFGGLARVEVEPADVPRAMELATEIEARMRAAGFERAVVDPEGYRSGRLNDALSRSAETP